MNLSDIKGIGPKTLNILNKLSIYTVNDLVRFYPYRYNIYKPSDITNCNIEDTIVVPCKIISEPKVSYIKRNFNRLSFMVEANNIPVNVVIFNRAFYKPNLKINRFITLIGKYNKLKNQFMASDIKFKFMNSIEVEPVYHSSTGISSNQISKLITNVLSTTDSIEEIVPEYISEKYNLMDTQESIREIHTPTNLNNLKQAKLKLKYEELFEFMFKINLIKYKNQIFDDFVIKDISDDTVKEVLGKVPFDLTNDQLNAINDIVKDFRNLKRMNRLILGDVGSGKTIVSFVSILLNKESGYQSALLAPTEVLAHQHYENFMSVFGNLGLKVELLVGSLKKSEKNSII